MFIIAHRGASAVAPESTRAAIRAAAAARADMVELDVQMTREGRLVVFHDDRLERTTNGRGRVSEARYAQLARLDAGSWFQARFTGERVRLLSQMLRAIPSRMRVNLELKRTPRRRALATRFVRIVRRAGVSRRLLVSSFDSQLLQLLRGSGLARALICSRAPEASLRRAIRLRCDAWHLRDALVTPRRIATAHGAGLRVSAWTVDAPHRAQQLQRWGIDGVFTNDPARLRRALS